MNEILIKKLKEFTEDLDDEVAIIKAKKEEFENSIKKLMEGKRALEFDIETMKATLTTEALEEFKKTGNKKLLGGIGIREGSVMSYDSEKALKFAKEKNMFLQLNKKAFEKVATSLDLDFVSTTPKTTVTFPAVIKL